MNAFVEGFGMALLVSMPPGVNTALCCSLARDGVRRATPVVVGAAAVDACYGTLGAAGMLGADALGSGPLRWAEPGLLLVAAGLLWPRDEVMSATVPYAAVGAVILNPVTATLWLGLAPLAHLHTGDPLTPGLWALGIAVGTASWFGALAILSTRLHGALGASRQRLLQKALCCLLAGGALLIWAR